MDDESMIDDGLRMMIPTVDHSHEQYAPFPDNDPNNTALTLTDNTGSSSSGFGLQRRGSHDSTDILQVPVYKDNPYASPDAGAYATDDFSFEDMKSQAKRAYAYKWRRPFSSKKLVGSLVILCITALAFLVTPWFLALGGGDDGDGDDVSSSLRGSPAEPAAPTVQVVKPTPPKCEDSTKILNGKSCHELANQCSEPTEWTDTATKMQLLVSHFCRLTCGECCLDDVDFTHKGYGCNHFVGQLTDDDLIASACAQKTKFHGADGEVLKVSDFCRSSCDTCLPPSGVTAETIKPEAEDKEVAATATKPEPESKSETEECKDNRDFVIDGFGCNEFVAGVVKPDVLAGRCAQETESVDADGNTLLVKNFCRESCGNCDSVEKVPAGVVVAEEKDEEVEVTESESSEPSEPAESKFVPEPEAKPADMPAETPDEITGLLNTLENAAGTTTETTQAAQETSSSCMDDPKFSHNGYTCDSFVANIKVPDLIVSRCSQETKWFHNGEVLLVSHFCRASCDTCDNDGGENAPTEDGVQETAAELEAPTEVSEPETTEEACEDDTEFVHKGYHCHHFVGQLTDANLIKSACLQKTDQVGPTGEALKVGDFCRYTCDTCSVSSPVSAAKPEPQSQTEEKPAQTSELKKTEHCKDDAKFTHKGYHCEHFVGQLTDANLIASACNQVTDWKDAAGETLTVSHFCRFSCNVCGDDDKREEN